jgi:NADH:ubiquinone oxidoreductase subunit 4 (subunit M)
LHTTTTAETTMRAVLWLAAITLTALAWPAMAQEDVSRTVTYDCISDETVEGELVRPTG